jgi:hypothetical protein
VVIGDKMNKETILKQFNEHGFEVLENIQSTKIPVVIQKDGYKFYICYNAIYKTWNPKKWGQNNPYSLDNLSLYLKRNNFKCTVISEEYNCDKIKLKCQCGNEYTVALNNLIRKHQDVCPQCSSKNSNIHRENHNKYVRYLAENNLEVVEQPQTQEQDIILCKKSIYLSNKNNNYIYFGTLYNALRSKKSADEYFKDSIFSIKNKYLKNNIEVFIKENNLQVEYLGTDKNRYNIFLKCPKCHKKFSVAFDYFLNSKTNTCKKCNESNKCKYDIKSFYLKNKLQKVDEFTNKSTYFLCKDRDGYYIRIKVETYGKVNPKSTIFHTCNPKVIDNIQHYIEINGLTCKLLSNKYINSKKSKLKFQCECGQMYYSTLYDFIARDYSKCNNCRRKMASLLERYTSEVLTELNVDFVREKTFKDCKWKGLLRFDFYLPRHNLCIECQGIQHYKVVEYFGGVEAFKNRIIKDKIKYDYCKNNNIKIVYIDYKNNKEDIYNILSQSIT